MVKESVFRYYLLFIFFVLLIPECLSQSIVKDFQFYSIGRDKITSYHRSVFGGFELNSTHLINEDTLLFEIDFTNSNQDTIYHLESSKIMSSVFSGNFSLGRNSIHIGTDLMTWSSRHPNLYDLKVSVTDSNNNLDTTFSENIGIRDLYWIENDLIINQEDSILKAFEIDTLISNLTTLHSAKSVFANSLFFKYLPAESVVEKCDSLGIYILINTQTISSQDELESFIKVNQNSPSLVAFYKQRESEHSSFVKEVLKEYKNFELLENKPENVILSPFKINELNEQRIQILKRKFCPFKFDVKTIGEDSINVKIDVKDFGSHIKDFSFTLNFYDLEGLNFNSMTLRNENHYKNQLELNIKIPDNYSLMELAKVELEIYPSYKNYWFNKDLPIFQLDIY